MKNHVQNAVAQALHQMQEQGTLSVAELPEPHVERTRERAHGDFATNVALTLARFARCKPRDLAQQIVAALPNSPLIETVEIAGPGFINFTMKATSFHATVTDALELKERFGRSDLGRGRPVQVEFVSANPTGPLHVGHGRGAAYGAAVADLLEAVGFRVQREYYVNDAGRQMHILATSVWLRYLELCGERFEFPSNGYRSQSYVVDIARTLQDEHADSYVIPSAEVFAGVPPDEPLGGDKEIHIDALVANARALLGDNRYRYVFELGLNTILDDIREDLREFGIEYEQWYSERSLAERGVVNLSIETLREAGHVYEDGGALWFRSTQFGDEKNRVLQRENGQTTYFASDIAYHLDKLARGFERVIDVWGADHHGYVPRVKAALTAMGEDAERLDILLVQFAILYRGGAKVPMSTRSGEFVTLRELREEVGNDAARFFYVMRRCEQHLDFDLDLAKSHTNDNPVYYIQYAHARICSVLRQCHERGLERDVELGLCSLGLLAEDHEQALLYTLTRYPEVLESAAMNEEPHQLAHYLRDLANDLHTYYNAHQFLVDEPALRDARLNLIQATGQALANGLGLLGVSAPERM